MNSTFILRGDFSSAGSSGTAQPARTRASRWRMESSLEDWVHDLAVHVGEAEVAALEAEGEPRVVDTEGVKDGGVEVVNVHRIADDVVTEVVGLAMADAGPDAAAGQGQAEAAAMVVAAVVRRRQGAL